ncbi:MAG: FeoB small GTPase domain-containing protein, partial [Pseudomonadota bacterium]
MFDDKTLRLSQLKEGEKGIIVKVLGPQEPKRRLRDLGFARETVVEVIRYAPLFDPVECRLGNSLVSIGLKEAQKIIIEPFSTEKPITLALCGNPNCGKTTIFNQLTGARQKVGNWPGVTVEKKEGATQYR